MSIGHKRNVSEQTWQARDVAEHCLLFNAEFVVGPRENLVASATNCQLFVRHCGYLLSKNSQIESRMGIANCGFGGNVILDNIGSMRLRAEQNLPAVRNSHLNLRL